MELTTILNRCHRFRGFVYEHARFSTDKKSIEVVLRPRKGSGRSLLALPFASTRIRRTLRAALPPSRYPPLQHENRPRLSSQGSVSAALGLQLARLGRPSSSTNGAARR